MKKNKEDLTKELKAETYYLTKKGLKKIIKHLRKKYKTGSKLTNKI